jgi:hypothetical protein
MQIEGCASMATPAVLKPILNIGRISDGRYKFSFSTDEDEGTLFCEVSVGRGSDASASDDQKRDKAICKLKRLLTEIDKVIKKLH